MAKSALQADPLAKRADETTTQWKMRVSLSRAITKEEKQKVNPFASLHGDYVERFLTHGEENTRAKVSVNRGGTPVCRWEAAGKLSPTQLLAIAHMTALWAVCAPGARLTANYGEQTAKGTGNAEVAAARIIEAREDLDRAIGYFPGPLRAYYEIFENVVRHGIAAGVAASGSEYGPRSAQDRACTVVQFVADIIAMNERL